MRERKRAAGPHKPRRPGALPGPATHTPTEHYILNTSYDTEGGPQGQISRLFFGVSKRCLCRKCLDRQGREDMKRLRARGIVA